MQLKSFINKLNLCKNSEAVSEPVNNFVYSKFPLGNNE